MIRFSYFLMRKTETTGTAYPSVHKLQFACRCGVTQPTQQNCYICISIINNLLGR